MEVSRWRSAAGGQRLENIRGGVEEFLHWNLP